MQTIDKSFFDTVHDRRNTGAVKYNCCMPSSSGRDIIPMWIADMDFKAPPAVEEELQKTIEHGIFGYTDIGDDYNELVASWYQNRFGWHFDSGCILQTPGVMFAVAAAIRALSEPGDSVLICQPVYYPFANVISANGRRLVVSELALKNGRYEIDFDNLEEQIRKNGVKLFLLCSPHNPVGRVWTRQELEEIGRICRRYQVLILSDEIHSDFVFTDRPHIPIASLSDELAQRTVTCTSPSKTFNLAGLQAANIVIPNQSIRQKVDRACRATGYSNLNTLAVAAVKAVYRQGQPWLDALLPYLQNSFNMLKKAFADDAPISLIQPEGTYLAWLDCRRLGLTDKELETFFMEEAGVRLHMGATFGAGGSGFVRMNIACPHSVLAEAIDRIRHACAKLNS